MADTNVTTNTTFELPMMAIFSVSTHGHKSVAHALNFDLVAVGSTPDEAVRKLRTSVKHHVEFGMRNGYLQDILHSAPDEAWAALTPDSTLKIGEPIVVDHHIILTGTRTIDETEPSLSAA